MLPSHAIRNARHGRYQSNRLWPCHPRHANHDEAGRWRYVRATGRLRKYGARWQSLQTTAPFCQRQLHDRRDHGPGGMGKTDSASWNEIAVKAAGIVTLCATLPKPHRRGGHDVSGEHKQIHIDVFKHADYLDFLVPINDFLSPASLLRAHV